MRLPIHTQKEREKEHLFAWPEHTKDVRRSVVYISDIYLKWASSASPTLIGERYFHTLNACLSYVEA